MAPARDNRKATAAMLGVALLLAGLGTVRAEDATNTFITTGHTTFLETSTAFNLCFAGIAGGLMQRVVWFNGATLFSRMTDGGGNTFVYVQETFIDQSPADGFDDETGVKMDQTDDAGLDPSAKDLFETGNVYDFPDENEPGVRWEVTEYYWLAEAKTPIPGDLGTLNVGQTKVYVFAVQVLDHAITDFTVGRDYNFVLVVDTCRFLHDGTSVDPQHIDGEDCGGANQDLPACQHEPADVPPGTEPGSHGHGEFSAGIWVGGAPKAVPVPTPDPAPGDGGAGP